MLSDAFRELLDIQEERLEAIRAECAPFVSGQHAESTAIHQRIVSDIDELLSRTRAFRAAAPQTLDGKRKALEDYGAVSKISMELCTFLFSGSHAAGPFRHPVLQKHAVLIHTIAREQVLTCVNTGWALIEETLAESKGLSPDNAPPAAAPKTQLRGHLRVVSNDGTLVERSPRPHP
ncbi:MAG: hypothetical protein HYS17_10755 [Micavibrio aeruginosavorus]|uniref:Uncharacterized protein n=1 Tax=Micavibrio aeruginosavorus TaxID=349221 RepID=A0A7T5R204_9BACT|nr:MAG: hypothetical protein HYS17_10755 [Micavibrio aeruginosavorus]